MTKIITLLLMELENTISYLEDEVEEEAFSTIYYFVSMIQQQQLLKN
jgi:hypothetical protein